MSSFCGGHVRAEGRDSLLLVLHAPACLGRLDVRFLARLTRSLGKPHSRVSSDCGPTPSYAESDFALSIQARRPFPCLLRLPSLSPLCLLVKGSKSKLRMTSASVLRRLYRSSLLSRIPYSSLRFHFSTLPILPPGVGSEWAGGKKGANADECRRVATVDTHQRWHPFFRRYMPH